MFFYLVLLLFVTAAGTAAFILLTCPVTDFKFLQGSQESNILVVNSKGKLIDNKDDLEFELQKLNYRLNEKEVKIAESKNKVGEVKKSISRLNASASEVKKYYAELQHEIDRGEKEKSEIKERINEYSRKVHMLRLGTKDVHKMLDVVHSKSEVSSESNFFKKGLECVFRGRTF